MSDVPEIHGSADAAHQGQDGQVDGQGDGADHEDEEQHQGGLQDGDEVLDPAGDDFVVVLGDVVEGLVEIFTEQNGVDWGISLINPVSTFLRGLSGSSWLLVSRPL